MDIIAKKIKNSKSGFTLLELVIVIAIIGILAVIGITKFGGITESAKESADLALAAEIGSSAKVYIATKNSTTAPTLQDLIDEKYLDSKTDTKRQSKEYKGGSVEIQVDSDSEITIKFDGKEVYPK